MGADKLGLAAMLILGLSWSAAAAAAGDAGKAPANWPAAAFNPQPSDDDFVLPMPCGGKMTFRRVETLVPEDNWMLDQSFYMGAAASEMKWSEAKRIEFIVGGFSNQNNPRTRFYYIGKYEISRAQYAAVSEKDCAAVAALAAQPDGALPVENASWFEAVDFSRQYSIWLRREALDALPKEDGVAGFVRLPSDTEWEYAARGGGIVSPAQQAENLFPMEGPKENYVWFENNCENLTQPIGLLKPNPLGLHDVLGNVGEVVLGPFQPTAPDRLHGATGGFTVRGGNCLTGDGKVRTANRQEEAFFDLNGERRPPMTGFRLVVASTFGVSQGRIGSLASKGAAMAEAPALASPVALTARGDTEAADAAITNRVRKLADRADRQSLKDELNLLEADIAASQRRHGELVGSAARAAVMSGAVLMRNYRQEKDESARLTQLLDRVSAESKPRFLEQIDRWNNRARLSGEAYLSLMIETADNIGVNKLKDNLPQVEASFSYEGSSGVVKMARRFVEQCRRYKDQPPSELKSFLDDLLTPL